MQNDEQLLVSTTAAARLLGVGRSLFYQMHSTGRLGPRPIQLNSKKLWRVAELQSWVRAGCPNRDVWNNGV